MTLEILSPCVIIVWALVLTVAERAFPYIPGYRVVRPDFWNDNARQAATRSPQAGRTSEREFISAAS